MLLLDDAGLSQNLKISVQAESLHR